MSDLHGEVELNTHPEDKGIINTNQELNEDVENKDNVIKDDPQHQKDNGNDLITKTKSLGVHELYDNNTIYEYKALLSNFEAFEKLAGLFAGFEGFIINEYTGKTEAETPLVDGVC